MPNDPTPAHPDRDRMVAALHPLFGARVRPDELLSGHGTFGVGGPADVWVTVQREQELVELVELAAGNQWPLMLVGNGTNVLFSDRGVRGIVARMKLCDWHVEQLDAEHARLVAGAGISLPKLINYLAAQGWAGLEWGAGVPGTIGGGIVSNAGAHGGCIADTLKAVRMLGTPAGPGERALIRELTFDELRLGYRCSRFRREREIAFDDTGCPIPASRALIEPAEIIIAGTFELRRDDPEAIRQRVERYKKHRKDTQPAEKSAGSVFKNPPGNFAGKLIDVAGLKGTRVGGAQISSLHGNFIVNTDHATAADVIGLIALARNTVLKRNGIPLELEVELRGDW